MTSVFALVFALMAPSGTATFDITVSPSDASIYVDGKRVKLQKGQVSVKPGTRSVKVSRSGYRSESKTVKASKGKTYRLKFSLSKTSSKRPAKKPVASKTPSKKPVAAKRPSKKPRAKRPARKPMKKPVASKRPSKRPVKKPRTKPRPNKKPAVGKRPSKRPVTSPGARPVGAQPIRDEAQPAPPSYRGYAIVSFLVGGAAIAGGAYMGTQADESADEFNRSVDRLDKQELKDDTEFQATAANVLYGVGAAGVVLGALLWAAEPDYRYSVAPMPGGGTYVGVEGRF